MELVREYIESFIIANRLIDCFTFSLDARFNDNLVILNYNASDVYSRIYLALLLEEDGRYSIRAGNYWKVKEVMKEKYGSSRIYRKTEEEAIDAVKEFLYIKEGVIVE